MTYNEYKYTQVYGEEEEREGETCMDGGGDKEPLEEGGVAGWCREEALFPKVLSLLLS